MDELNKFKNEVKKKEEKQKNKTKQKSIFLFYLYLCTAILYLIHTGVDIPTKIDDWLHANPSFIYLLVGTIYMIISFQYLEYYIEYEKSIALGLGHRIIQMGFLLLLLYVWYELIRTTKKSKLKNLRFI
jgi:uncharacterized membrane protein YesL